MWAKLGFFALKFLEIVWTYSDNEQLCRQLTLLNKGLTADVVLVNYLHLKMLSYQNNHYSYYKWALILYFQGVDIVKQWNQLMEKLPRSSKKKM